MVICIYYFQNPSHYHLWPALNFSMARTQRFSSWFFFQSVHFREKFPTNKTKRASSTTYPTVVIWIGVAWWSLGGHEGRPFGAQFEMARGAELHEFLAVGGACGGERCGTFWSSSTSSWWPFKFEKEGRLWVLNPSSCVRLPGWGCCVWEDGGGRDEWPGFLRYKKNYERKWNLFIL
jgi:hypothetical protein